MADAEYGEISEHYTNRAEKAFSDSIYVSGPVDQMSDDGMADSPYDTVPRKVRQLFESQIMQTRISSIRRLRGESTPGMNVDRLIPIIADGKSGHGGPTTNMKLAKLFVEAGAGGLSSMIRQLGREDTESRPLGRHWFLLRSISPGSWLQRCSLMSWGGSHL